MGLIIDFIKFDARSKIEKPTKILINSGKTSGGSTIMIAYRSTFSMGTRMEMVFPGLDDEVADKIFRDVKNLLEESSDLLSIYDPKSLFSRLNENAFHRPFQLDTGTFSLFETLLSYSRKSRGYFDFSLGISKRKIYGGRPEDLLEVIAIPLQERIILDRENLTIRLGHEKVKLDSGAFGKGFALDSVKKMLDSYRIKDVFVNFGDSSILTLGSHPSGPFWKVGIRDIMDTRKNAWVFEINDGFVSSSGNSFQNRVRTEEGHMINPVNGSAENGNSLVSVKGPTGLETEIFSTALYLMPFDERRKMLEEFTQLKAIEISYNKENQTTETIELN